MNFGIQVKSTLAIAALIGRDAREYKVFTVSKATGAVEAMKIRELSAS